MKTYLYDAAGQLTNWVVTATNDWSRSRDLRYDAGGRIVTQSVIDVVRTNIYDKTDQLLSSSGSYSYSATYDAVGNRQIADGGTYTVNNLNQYTEIINGSTATLSYDANGNVTDWNGQALLHDSVCMPNLCDEL